VQSIYWFCFAIGGVFVALSIFGGGDLLGDADADFDADFDADADADFDADADADGDLQVDTDIDLLRNPRRRRRIPFWLSILTSFKFWTFGGCFFGLTGLLIGFLEPGLAPGLVLGVAIAVGSLCGGVLTSVLRGLKQRQVNSLVRNEDFAGLLGTVELPFDTSSKGKVLLEVGGSTLHLVAQTDEKIAFQIGDPVLVVGRTNSRLWVVSAQNSFERSDDRLE
jgi:membrane protein implicated in regulation of membrane protease activity